ncbi:MAG: mRNA surveillance protein pelota [Archaeoglobaceae archaeon]|nr:mRNA surveillance protein pelota [Archaeoglobaceae archaeon]MDW8128173.1 mRNA surveillance protein pelota [Archaeoglobaceae archaeon]
MRIVEENLRDHEGEIKLIPENLDDLWHLKFIVERGDLVFSLTKRVSHSDDKLRGDKELITVRIGIEVDKVEFHKFANRLRISGRIVSGVEESGFHTLNVSIGKELSILKKWKEEQLKRLRKAVESSKRPEVVILTIEEGEAIAGALRDWGVEEIFEKRTSYAKDYGGARKEFFEELFETLKNLNFRFLVLAGPGFTKKDFYDYLRQKDAEMAKRTVIVDTSMIGKRGFVEVLKRRTIDRLIGEIRLAEEAELVDRLLEGIAKNEKVSYGLEEVKKAKEYGAIEILLVSDDFLLKERENWAIDEFMQDVEKAGGKVLILSSEFEPGEIVSKLGGICAILRFEIK